MRWFRTNRQSGSRLALIALALQLVLTFGHVHAPLATVASVVQATPSHDAMPQGPNHNGIADSDCPTCALIQLSAISVPSVAPQLPLSLVIGFVTLRPRAEVAAATATQASFQARAPPAV
jgi:hypothetical protein